MARLIEDRPKMQPHFLFGDLSWVKITDEAREAYRKVIEERDPLDVAPWMEPITKH
jgi:hypothetical protein